MRTRTWILLATLTLAPAVAVPAHENEATGLERRIALSLAGAAATDVFASFGAIAGMEVEIDPELEGQVTIELQEVRIRDALDIVCNAIECSWTLDEVEDGGVLRIDFED